MPAGPHHSPTGSAASQGLDEGYFSASEDESHFLTPAKGNGPGGQGAGSRGAPPPPRGCAGLMPGGVVLVKHPDRHVRVPVRQARPVMSADRLMERRVQMQRLMAVADAAGEYMAWVYADFDMNCAMGITWV